MNYNISTFESCLSAHLAPSCGKKVKSEVQYPKNLRSNNQYRKIELIEVKDNHVIQLFYYLIGFKSVSEYPSTEQAY